MQIAKTTIGVDVSQAVLDVWIHPIRECWQIDNNPSASASLASALQYGPSLVVVEATGGLETCLVASLSAEDLPAVIVNPRQVRDFARATGRSSKRVCDNSINWRGRFLGWG